MGRRIYSIVRQRIKRRIMVHQERQRKVFCILFIIFAIVYIIILIFIGATFKFIEIIVIILAKGLLGMLGLFYNNNKGAGKEEESKQSIKPQSSPKLGHAILTPTFIILGTDNP